MLTEAGRSIGEPGDDGRTMGSVAWSGQTLTLSSMAARTSTPGEAAYAGSKAALSGFFEALAGELRGSGISFHLMYPALSTSAPGSTATTRSRAAPIPQPRCWHARSAESSNGATSSSPDRT